MFLLLWSSFIPRYLSCSFLNVFLPNLHMAMLLWSGFITAFPDYFSKLFSRSYASLVYFYNCISCYFVNLFVPNLCIVGFFAQFGLVLYDLLTFAQFGCGAEEKNFKPAGEKNHPCGKKNFTPAQETFVKKYQHRCGKTFFEHSTVNIFEKIWTTKEVRFAKSAAWGDIQGLPTALLWETFTPWCGKNFTTGTMREKNCTGAEDKKTTRRKKFHTSADFIFFRTHILPLLQCANTTGEGVDYMEDKGPLPHISQLWADIGHTFCRSNSVYMHIFPRFPRFPQCTRGEWGEDTWRIKLHFSIVHTSWEISGTHFGLVPVYKCTYFPDFTNFPSAHGGSGARPHGG